MPANPPPRSLLLPGKVKNDPHDATDKRIMERWARQPIQQIVAGSGITLDPPSGLATDSEGNGPNPVKITATGGGGGNPGWFGIVAGPDLGDGLAGQFYYPLAGTNQTFGPSGNATNFPLFSGPGGEDTGIFGLYPFYVSWWGFTAAGFAVNLLPVLYSPSFTSPGGNLLQIELVYWVSDVSFTNFALYTTSHFLTLGSFTSYQVQPSDLSLVANGGTDLSSPTAGGSPGFSGNGIITTAGGAYLAGVSGLCETNPDMTFP